MEEDYEYRATLQNWTEFKESAIWRDMENFLRVRIESHRDMLEAVDSEDLDLLQSKVAALRELLYLPDEFIQQLATEGELE